MDLLRTERMISIGLLDGSARERGTTETGRIGIEVHADIRPNLETDHEEIHGLGLLDEIGKEKEERTMIDEGTKRVVKRIDGTATMIETTSVEGTTILTGMLDGLGREIEIVDQYPHSILDTLRYFQVSCRRTYLCICKAL